MPVGKACVFYALIALVLIAAPLVSAPAFAEEVHYYSVRSTATGSGSNYDNNGATGTNAMAAGPWAS
ncbi:MAG: hypothetical protein IKT09_08485, partial [Synergistes sp.]|nr:hypothetical protein [Synergistes sp.]